MTDLTQKVKYEVVVDLAQLTNLKKELDNAEDAARKLGASLDKLAGANVKGLRSLGGTVQALGTRLEKFATTTDPASAAITRLKAALESIPPAAAKVATATTTAAKAVAASGDATEAVTKKTHDWRLSMLKYYGSFHAIRYTLVNAFAEIKQGAQQIDLDNTLTKQFSNFRAEIARTQEMTAGTVGRGQLTRSFALMSSFGIPMDKFAENMTAVQKMAVRTGQSADFLADSFARGISRLSPLILDNLGIQVSLKDANLAYANSVGKAVTAMSKQEQVGALLNQVLEKIAANTKNVDLNTGSVAASVARFDTAIDDVMLGLKEAGGTVLGGFDILFESAATSVSRLATAMGKRGDAVAAQYEWVRGMGVVDAALIRTVSNVNAAHSALKVLATDEDLADLFGNQDFDPTGGMGTTTARARGIAQFAEPTFLAHLEITRTRLKQIGAHMQEIGSGDWSALSGALLAQKNDAADTGAAFALMRMHLDNAANAVDVMRQEYGGVLSVNEQLALVTKAREMVEARVGVLLRQAFMETKKGITFAAAIAAIYDQQEASLAEMSKIITKMFADTAAMAVVNRAQLEIHEALVTAFSQHAVWNQRIYDLKEGMLLPEMALRDAETQRQNTLKAIDDLVKDTHDRTMNAEETERYYKLSSHLLALDQRRAEYQFQKQIDDALLASYKDKTRQQIEEDAKRIESFAEAMHAIAESFRATDLKAYQQHKEMAIDLENRAKRIRAINAGGSGGGGAGPGAPKPEKPDQGWGWDYEAVFARQEAEREALERFKEQAERLKEMRSELRRALTEDPSGRQAADALAEIKRMFAEMSEEHGAAWTTNMLTKMFGVDGIREIFSASDAVDNLSDSFDRLINIAKGFENVSIMLGEFRKGMSSIHGDLFGGEFISMIDDVGSAFDNLAEIQRKNAEATDKSNNAYNNVIGGIGAMRAFTQNLIKDRRDQAKVEMLMQAAAAWAAWAIPDPVKAMGHTMAATMYGLVGFGAIKLPSGKAKSTTPRESRPGADGGAKRPDIHIHISGNVVQTEAERGVMAQAAIQEARRRGMM